MFRLLSRFVGIAILATAVVNHPMQLSAFAEQALNSVSSATNRGDKSNNSKPELATINLVRDEVRFTDRDGSRPVLWNTCEVVPVLINPGTYGDEGVKLIERGIKELATLTGVRFKVTGITDKVPTSRWYAEGGVEGFEGFAPVIVAIVKRNETDLLADDAIGSAVANPAGEGRDRRLVTGAVALNEDSLSSITRGFKNGSSWGTILMHELGHLAGLDHAPGGLMATTLSGSMKPSFSPAIVNVFNAYRPVC